MLERSAIETGDGAPAGAGGVNPLRWKCDGGTSILSPARLAMGLSPPIKRSQTRGWCHTIMLSSRLRELPLVNDRTVVGSFAARPITTDSILTGYYIGKARLIGSS